MPAYIVAEVTVSDPERFRAYQDLARPAVERYGGTFTASSTDVRPLEGGWRPQRIVVVGFESLERCRAFYDSPEYQAAIQARMGAAQLQIIAVEGVARPAPGPNRHASSEAEEAMPAYMIAEIEVTNPQQYEEYKKFSPGAIATYGGRFVARGGQTVVLEGDWHPKRVVIVEFDSLERAQQFYNSPEYKQAIAARTGAANARMVAVEGL